MVDWTSGTPDASVAERDSAFVALRVPGSPDTFKETAVSGFVTKDASGNALIGTGAPAATSGRNLTIGSIESSLHLSSSAGRSWAITSGANFQYTANSLCFFSNFHGGNAWLIDPNLHLLPGGDAARNFGSASFRINSSFFAVAPTVTSDKRAKRDIGDIPEAWLDAWAGVQWCRFKMVGGTRWHTGLVAQQVHSAFAAHNLDAFEIGLCCFDAWDEISEPIFETTIKSRTVTSVQYTPAGETAEGIVLFKQREATVDEEYLEQIDTGKTRVTLEAGDRWGLRYDECQAIEAAYQRRELSRMAARLAVLENQS